MRVAFSLPALQSYRDRLDMLCALSTYVDRLYLLTDEVDEESAHRLHVCTNIQVVTLGRKDFKSNAFAWLHAQTHVNALDIVHDTFGHLSAFFQACSALENRSFRLLTTLYTNNWGWFNRVRQPHMDFGWSYVAQRIVTLWRDRRVCRSADRVLVLGPGLEDELVAAHGVDRHRIEWLPSEVNTSLFCPTDSPPEHGRLLFTGAICRNKGIDVLLEALSLIDMPQVTLRLVGRVLPWEKTWFSKALKAEGLTGRVECPGEVPREALVREYQRAHLYVFPSRFEGSPRSVREALASGLPCILSDLPGHRAVDPDHAFTHRVDAFEPRVWADAIQTAMAETTSDWARRRHDGIEHMHRAHQPDAVAGRLVDVYRRTLAAPPPVQS